MWYIRENDELVCRAERVQQLLEHYKPECRTVITAVHLDCDHRIIEHRAYFSPESGRWTYIEDNLCIYDFSPVKDAQRTLLAAMMDYM